jgi:periplasmic mercuric ion binding protein
MKKLFVTIVAIVFVGFLQAQVMQAKQKWVTIKSANLRCWECKEKLDQFLVLENNTNYEKGMLQWKYNLLACEIKVLYLPDRITPDDIRTAMNNAGFDADTTKAVPEMYKKLPPACKRVEDGGGPAKGKPCHIEPQ